MEPTRSHVGGGTGTGTGIGTGIPGIVGVLGNAPVAPSLPAPLSEVLSVAIGTQRLLLTGLAPPYTTEDAAGGTGPPQLDGIWALPPSPPPEYDCVTPN